MERKRGVLLSMLVSWDSALQLGIIRMIKIIGKIKIIKITSKVLPEHQALGAKLAGGALQER